MTAESILRLSTPKKVLMLVVVFLLILVLFWQFSYRPQKERIARKERKLTNLINERNLKRKLAKGYEKYKAELEVIRGRLKEVMAKLPEQKEIPLLLKSISNIGKEAGLDILLFKPKGEQVREFYAEVPFELKFMGNYHRIGLFFYSVGKLPRIVAIKDFSLQRASKERLEGGAEVLLECSCTAMTYRFVEQPQEARVSRKGRKR